MERMVPMEQRTLEQHPCASVEEDTFFLFVPLLHSCVETRRCLHGRRVWPMHAVAAALRSILFLRINPAGAPEVAMLRLEAQ